MAPIGRPRAIEASSSCATSRRCRHVAAGRDLSASRLRCVVARRKEIRSPVRRCDPVAQRLAASMPRVFC
eukprot:8426151-Pyramimonas_sp.AAC.1